MDPCVPKARRQPHRRGRPSSGKGALAGFGPEAAAHGDGGQQLRRARRRAPSAREEVWARMSWTELWESMPLSYRIGKPIAVAGAKSDQWSASCTSVWSSRPAKVPAPAKCFLVKLKQNESLRYRTCAKNFCLLKFG